MRTLQVTEIFVRRNCLVGPKRLASSACIKGTVTGFGRLLQLPGTCVRRLRCLSLTHCCFDVYCFSDTFVRYFWYQSVGESLFLTCQVRNCTSCRIVEYCRHPGRRVELIAALARPRFHSLKLLWIMYLDYTWIHNKSRVHTAPMYSLSIIFDSCVKFCRFVSCSGNDILSCLCLKRMVDYFFSTKELLSELFERSDVLKYRQGSRKVG